jgi:transcriptional regulator with XRE-family HTH domain
VIIVGGMQILPYAETIPRELRSELGRLLMKQSELANKVGWSGAAVNRRLNGKTPITISELEQLAAGLGLELRIELSQPSRAQRRGGR